MDSAQRSTAGYDEAFGQFDSSKGTYVIDGLNGKPVLVSTIGQSPRKQRRWRSVGLLSQHVRRDEAKLVHFDQGRSVENIDITATERPRPDARRHGAPTRRAIPFPRRSSLCTIAT